jgi:RimJ/RimL family protein N-acetyltransferase
LIRRTRELLREEGIRGVWFGGLARLRLYRRLELVALDLHPPPALRETPLALEYAFLTTPRDEREQGRLARGDRCFAAWQDDRVVSSRWIAEGRAYVEYLDTWLALSDEDVYLSETHTEPSMRGQGVSGAAGTRLAAALAAEGKRRIVAGVLAENHAGRRAYEKAGYLRLGRIGWYQLGPWRHEFGWDVPAA